MGRDRTLHTTHIWFMSSGFISSDPRVGQAFCQRAGQLRFLVSRAYM